MWKKLNIALVLLFVQTAVYADDLFATGWGYAFDASAYGQLFFTAMEVLGIVTCIKSLAYLYQYVHGKQQRFGYWTCLIFFFAGVALYFMHDTLNLLYTSFHI